MKTMQKQLQTNRLAGTAYGGEWFEAIFVALDELHDDVCAGRLNTLSGMALEEMVGWLDDIVYTAQETIVEIKAITPARIGTLAGRPGPRSGGDHDAQTS